MQIAGHGFGSEKEPLLKAAEHAPGYIREPFLSPFTCAAGTHDMIFKMVFPVMHGERDEKTAAAGGQQSWPLVNYVIKSRGSQKN